MMRREAIRFVRHEAGLDRERKEALIGLLDEHPSRTCRIVRWTRALTALCGPGFDGLLSFQKMDMLRWLKEAMGGGPESRTCFGKLLAIVLCEASSQGAQEGYCRFSDQLLDRLRSETHLAVKATMVETLLRLPATLPRRMGPEDLRGGLHHEDEVVRCRTLSAIHERFGTKGLHVALREIQLLGRPPSLPFWGTLRFLIQQHPEMVTDSAFAAAFHVESEPDRRMDRRNTEQAVFQGSRGQRWRIGFRLTCVSQMSQSCATHPASRRSPAQRQASLIIREERFWTVLSERERE